MPPTSGRRRSEIEHLRARYKHVREPILVVLSILLLDPNIALEDAKE